ncbi:MAG TPA: aspartate carbamoyltransferase [Mollicutes bacterium]|nr:aspartate carbamoyltransferase [Mollicutes bacterium]
MLKGRSIICPDDLSIEEIDDLFLLANDIIINKESYKESCNGYILATLFFESSTRTRLSFEAAMHKLGGDVVGFSDFNSSSVAKGESITDTVRTVECYSDLIVLRHPKEGAPILASNVLDIPLINAGDGAHYHPTQTLTDLYTIYNYKKKIDNLVIGICGDLKFGRTVHSLIKVLCKYKNISFVFISPDKLRLPDYIIKVLDKEGIKYIETDNLDNMKDLDVLYMTRVQKERFFNEEDYIKLKDKFIINNEVLKSAKEDLIIMHPLPRNNEISSEVDLDKRAVYFKQAKYGLYIRMALILKLLGIK